MMRIESIIARVNTASCSEVRCCPCASNQQQLKAQQNTELLTINQMRFGSLHHELIFAIRQSNFLLQLSQNVRQIFYPKNNIIGHLNSYSTQKCLIQLSFYHMQTNTDTFMCFEIPFLLVLRIAYHYSEVNQLKYDSFSGLQDQFQMDWQLLKLMKKEFDETVEVLNSSTEHPLKLTDQHLWTLIDSHLQHQGLVSHQLDSYHHFLQDFKHFIKEEARIELRIVPQFKERREEVNHQIWSFTFEQPINFSLPYHRDSDGSEHPVTPMECRLRNLSYLSRVTANLRLTRKTDIQDEPEHKIIEQQLFDHVELCQLPVMVKSKLCHTFSVSSKEKIQIEECLFDQGGYFICQGAEKVIVGQERELDNTLKVRNTELVRQPCLCEVKSKARGFRLRTDLFKIVIKLDKTYPYVLCRHKCLITDMPISLLLRALGLTNDINIFQIVCGIDFLNSQDLNEQFVDKMAQILRHSLSMAVQLTPEESLITLGKYLSFTKDKESSLSCLQASAKFLRFYLLNHLGQDYNSFLKKARYIGHMTRKVIEHYLSNENQEDSQHLSLKRVDLAGRLLMDLFFFEFKKYSSHVVLEIKKIIGEGKDFRRRFLCIFDSRIITNGIKSAIKTGNWGNFRQYGLNRSGISQDLRRQTNYLSTLSHLRRLSAPFFSNSRNVSRRHLHNTHFGMYCPAQTPQGVKIGIVKNFAFLAKVSNNITDEEYQILIKNVRDSAEEGKQLIKGELTAKKEQRDEGTYKKESSTMKKQQKLVKTDVTPKKEPTNSKREPIRIKMESLRIKSESTLIKGESFSLKNQSQRICQQPEIDGLPILQNNTKIMIDGDWLANTSQPAKCVHKLRCLRRQGLINYQISIAYQPHTNEIHISTDDGRCMRPLLMVENNFVKLQPSDLSSGATFDSPRFRGVIEYLDAEQEENCLIAMDQSYLINTLFDYSHCQIHPSMIFGICASFIPFSNHNQSTKNTLQSAMVKQSLGLNTLNSSTRMDVSSYQLYYPQKPLVTTKQTKHTTLNFLPIGVNPIVAMAVFTGYNQQDSVIINQSSIQRGMFRTVHYRTYEAEQKIGNYGGDHIVIAKPSKIVTDGNYHRDSSVDIDGLPQLAQHVSQGDVIIGHLKLANNNKHDTTEVVEPKDVSVRLKRGERGFVEKVMIGENSAGFRVAKIKIREVKIPQIGDKFASRHGQKGTCGMMFRQEDLPFTLDGIVPDMIVNPHCIPSRMTIGHIMECLAGKYSAIHGITQDATPFCEDKIELISQALHRDKCQRYGSQQMLNPYNGLSLGTPIFIGPIYYQRLRHLVGDKIYSRARGMIDALTRQPLKGRNRDGGLRFGQMQKDCILSHGLTEVLKERLFTASDFFTVTVCAICGMMVNTKSKDFKAECRICLKRSRVYEVQMPYATKLMMQELISMHVVPRLQFTRKESRL